MSVQESSTDRKHTAAHNLWVLFAVVTLDLGLCLLLPSLRVRPQETAWKLAVFCLGLHIPFLALVGCAKRHARPSRFLTSAVVIVVFLPALTILLALIAFMKIVPIAAFISLWLLSSLLAPVFVFALICRELGHAWGKCVSCGYSRQGLTSSTCPECGTLQPATTSSS